MQFHAESVLTKDGAADPRNAHQGGAGDASHHLLVGPDRLGQTIDSLRDHLGDEGVAPWTNIHGLRLKLWISDRRGNRWGGVMLWDHGHPADGPMPPNRATELIGYPPTERVQFDVEAIVEAGAAKLFVEGP